MSTEAQVEPTPSVALKMEVTQTKECRQPLEAEKGKEMESSLEPPEGTQFCLHLDFSPVRSMLDF